MRFVGNRILVVDDEKPIVDILKYNLTKEGYEVLAAYDGEEAIEVAFSQRPDLILLDVMLPKKDGFAVCKKLREKLICPIIMLTAKGEDIPRSLIDCDISPEGADIPYLRLSKWSHPPGLEGNGADVYDVY